MVGHTQHIPPLSTDLERQTKKERQVCFFGIAVGRPPLSFIVAYPPYLLSSPLPSLCSSSLFFWYTCWLWVCKHTFFLFIYVFRFWAREYCWNPLFPSTPFFLLFFFLYIHIRVPIISFIIFSLYFFLFIYWSESPLHFFPSIHLYTIPYLLFSSSMSITLKVQYGTDQKVVKYASSTYPYLHIPTLTLTYHLLIINNHPNSLITPHHSFFLYLSHYNQRRAFFTFSLCAICLDHLIISLLPIHYFNFVLLTIWFYIFHTHIY